MFVYQYKISFMCRSDGISYLWLITCGRKWIIVSSPGELQHGPLGVGAAGADEHVLGVLDSGDGAGSEQDLLPGLLQVDDVDTIILLLEDVLLHGGLGVGRPEVGGGSQHLSDVIFLQRGLDEKMSTLRILYYHVAC